MSKSYARTCNMPAAFVWMICYYKDDTSVKIFELYFIYIQPTLALNVSSVNFSPGGRFNDCVVIGQFNPATRQSCFILFANV